VLFVPSWLRSCGTLILRALSILKQILRLVYGLSPRPTCWPRSPARFSTTSSSVKSVCKAGLFRRTSLSSEQVEARRVLGSGFEFRCIHHGDKTANTRQLEDHVERDEENTINTRRKQEFTNINARSCLYLVILIRKQLRRRGSSVFSLVLGVHHDTYSHLMVVNPLRYKKEYV
jgi:hypothetical protein